MVRKDRAEMLLQTHQQHPYESAAVFVEEMQRLLRHTDPSMPKAKKVRYLMRGVKDNLFAGLVRDIPTTVAQYAAEFANIDKAMDMPFRQYCSTTGLPFALQDRVCSFFLGSSKFETTMGALEAC